MKNILFALVTVLTFNGLAQVKQVSIGQWREHLPYNIAYDLCHTGSGIYVSSSFSGFYYDLGDLTQNPLGKAAGYADFDVAEIAYNKENQTAIFGYKSGMVDLKVNSTIYRINDISRAAFDGSKSINHIFTRGRYAYIAGDFGLSVLDLVKKEIKETYRNLTSNGQSNKIFSSTLSDDGDSIFLASDKGLLTARISPSINLLDYNNWYLFPATSGIPVTDVSGVCFNNGILYAGVNFKGIYYYNGAAWTQCQFMWDFIKSLTSSNNKLTFCHYETVFTMTSPYSAIGLTDTLIRYPYEAIYDENNTLWVASSGWGLVKFVNDKPIEIHPTGPQSKNSFHLLYNNNKIISCAGGYNSSFGFQFSELGFYIFSSDNFWSTYENKKTPLLTSLRDFNYSVYNPVNGKYYISSYFGGMVVMNEDNSMQVLNNSNSPILPSVLGIPCVTGTAVDASGNIWVCNKITATSNVITVMTPEHTLVKRIQLPITGDANRILFDDVGNTWIIVADHAGNHGLVVLQSNGNFVNLKNYLPSDKVNCVSKDKKGSIWIGTDKGIAICYDPSDLTRITTPIFDGFPLLYERSVQCIEVDGGNRKWMGTNNGLWLFNDDATEVELYFDSKNAPIPSSNIMDIEINTITGEVFFATELGTVSYRGDATEGVEKHKEITIFPNPVKPGFTGFVGIQGLTPDAEIKITDIYGTLVYQCKATGGMAVWNIKDYNGTRAQTGVYLIFSSNPEGTDGIVGRIAVVE